MNKLFLLMFLCSCAAGSTYDSSNEDSDKPTVAAAKSPASNPPPEPVSESTPTIKCVIEAYASGNCYVVKIYCENKPTQVEVSCSHGYLFPWEYIPDPPPDYKPGSRRE